MKRTALGLTKIAVFDEHTSAAGQPKETKEVRFVTPKEHRKPFRETKISTIMIGDV